MQQVKAVVALAQGEPVQLTTINVPDPGPGGRVLTPTRPRRGRRDRTGGGG